MRLFRYVLLGLMCCLAGLFGLAKAADRDDGGAALMFGGVMVLFGGVCLFFCVRRLIEGNQAPPK